MRTCKEGELGKSGWPRYVLKLPWSPGGILLILFGVQVLTGALLGVYYEPSVTAAYDSIELLSNKVYGGRLVRSIHHWASHAMIALGIVHLISILWHRAFNVLKRGNWLTGALAFLICLVFAFTGYLLPWDQRAFWAVTVGTEYVAKLPVFGDGLSQLLKGGSTIGQPTLLRFYLLHLFVLPGLFLVLISVHLWILKRQGFSCIYCERSKRCEDHLAALRRQGTEKPEPEREEVLHLGRRRMMQVLFAGIAVVFGGILVRGLGKYLTAPEEEGTEEDMWVLAAVDTEIKVGEIRRVILNREPIYLLRTASGFKALSAVCTHMACVNKWDAKAQEFVCPCHRARFDIEGKVLEGPASKPLPKHYVRVAGGEIYVGPEI